jgi:hypothetical protein
MIGQALGLIKATTDMMINNDYDNRKVDKIERNGLILSTVYTTDQGYESAIIDSLNVYPVERYKSKEDAINGHKKWDKKLDKLEEITCLGYDDLVDEKQVTLKRKIVLTKEEVKEVNKVVKRKNSKKRNQLSFNN